MGLSFYILSGIFSNEVMKKYISWCRGQLLGLFSPKNKQRQEFSTKDSFEVSVADFFIGLAYILEKNHGLFFYTFSKKVGDKKTSHVARQRTEKIVKCLHEAFAGTGQVSFLETMDSGRVWSNEEFDRFIHGGYWEFFCEIDPVIVFDAIELDSSYEVRARAVNCAVSGACVRAAKLLSKHCRDSLVEIHIIKAPESRMSPFERGQSTDPVPAA